jgi:hypothetical protein
MLLTTSLRINPDGQPHVPGNLEVWRNLFIHHPHGKYDGKLTRSAANWRNTDDLVEALFGLSRKTVENEPLKIFLALSDIDRVRAKPMSGALASRLVSSYRTYGQQYYLFAEGPALSEASIQQYLDDCGIASQIHDSLLKSDTVGTLQSLVELWRILTLQNAIPLARQDASFTKLIAPFDKIRSQAELFDAGRAGIDVLIAAAKGQAAGSRQEQIVELLVGTIRGDSSGNTPAAKFLRVYDSQLLIPVDSLFRAADRAGKGDLDPKTARSINDQLERLEETQSLHSSISGQERNAFALGYWSDRHVDQERKFKLDALLKGTEKRDPRAALEPFLRDSLVGFVYSYYAPAGAQLLLTNPSLVRTHDFIGPESTPALWRMTEVTGSGWPASAGGRMMGSLIGLPYAIAEAEQNFLSPKREQALIWADLVPQMIVEVTVNRWRNVKPEQIRYVSLHIERGENLLAAAALDPSIETPVMNAIRKFSTPAMVEWIDDQLHSGHFADAADQIPPSVFFGLAQDPSLKNVSPDTASLQIAALEARNQPDLTPEAIARCFGTPKPTLTHSYTPGLLNVRLFPALMGFSSRILAESWQSNNLYFAALADQAAVPVDQLDSFVPEWNRAAIENIFATHLEDWPALLRSLHVVAKNIREHGTQQQLISNSEY